MMKIKAIFLSLLLVFSFSSISNSQNIPNSFADLAEKLMPSVVNISTTQTVVTRSNPFPNFQFPPGSPFEDMFKEFGIPNSLNISSKGDPGGNWKFGNGLLLVTTVWVVEIFTTEGINFSAKSANELGIFWEFDIDEKLNTNNKERNIAFIFIILTFSVINNYKSY